MSERTRELKDISGDEKSLEAARIHAQLQEQVRGLHEAGMLAQVMRQQDSYEIDLQDGRTATMRMPAGSMMRTIAIIAGEMDKASPLLTVSWLKPLMYVSAIDGKPIPAIRNMTEAQRVSDMLGDRGCDIIAYAWQKLWPPLTDEDEKSIIKNF